ncbi:MAG: fumarylacetoacetate hydrolase family protein [Halobacteriaceae archaeon]
MRYYRHPAAEGLLARDGDALYDLGTAGAPVDDFESLAARAAEAGTGVDDVARDLLADTVDAGAEEAEVTVADADFEATVDAPATPPEVWAAGVTYRISQEARQAESSMPDMYIEVYDAERPEVFFKATPSRTVGPGEGAGIRADSDWDVPEPELGVVLYRGDIVGFTVGNDMSSRDIEGQNPLYLPQAKVYDRCCALGPAIASPETVDDPHDLEMTVAIERDGEVVFKDATNTGEMVRTCEELASYLQRHNRLPDLTVLLTGTSLVPPDEFTLREGDAVTIDVESIGTLANPVVEV